MIARIKAITIGFKRVWKRDEAESEYDSEGVQANGFNQMALGGPLARTRPPLFLGKRSRV